MNKQTSQAIEHDQADEIEMNNITQARLKELLHYDTATGVFTWLASGSGRRTDRAAGSMASNGYIQIRIDYRKHLAHRLAFLYMDGEIPEQIDHDNHIRGDNRWINLNSASQTINQRNRTKNSNNTSGFTGICWHKAAIKWRASIQVDGKCIYLGIFADKSDAIAARRAANTEHGFHINHGVAQ